MSTNKRIGIITPHLETAGGPRTIVNTANLLKKAGYNITVIPRRKSAIHKDTVLETPIFYSEKLNNLDDFDIIMIYEMDGDTHMLFTEKYSHIKKILFTLAHGEPAHVTKDRVLTYPFNLATVTSNYLEKALLSHNVTFPVAKIGWYPQNAFKQNVVKFRNQHFTIGVLQHKDKQKRYDVALRLFDRLHQRSSRLKFVTMGYGKADRVYIQHYKNPNFAQMQAMYDSVDIWLVPSVNEGVGKTGIEALLAGCAVLISNDNGGGKDFIINGQTGFIAPLDDFEKTIVNIIKMKDADKNNIIKNGINYIKTNYTKEKYVANLTNAIEMVDKYL